MRATAARSRLLRLVLATLALGSHAAPGQSLLTAAGQRLDAIYATASPLALVWGVAAAPGGDAFVTQRSLGRVMRVARSTGLMSTVAGNGLQGPTAPGVPARETPLLGPQALAVDGRGDLLVGTAGGTVVRVSAATGLTTVVATVPGLASLASDGAGNVLVACTDDRVRKVAPDGGVTVVAGTGQRGFSGDGGPATLARLALSGLDNPGGMLAVDRAGGILVVDQGNARVRRVSPEGLITTVAGNGVSATAGDGGPAPLASIQKPVGVAVDGQGNVFVSSFWDGSASGRVRKVSPDGVITTAAGGGTSPLDGVPAREALLFGPSGLAVDAAGDLLVGDMYRVRRLSAATGLVGTVAGVWDRDWQEGWPSTAARLAFPLGVAFDPAGNLLVADPVDQRVRRVLAASGQIETLAGGGSKDPYAAPVPAKEASLSQGPVVLAVTPQGDVLIGLWDSPLVYRLSASTGLLSRLAGRCCGGGSPGAGIPGPALDAQLFNLGGLAADAAGNVTLASGGLLRVRPDGYLEVLAGGGTKPLADGAAGTDVAWFDVQGVALGPGGEPYFAVANAASVWRLSGGVLRLVAGTGEPGYSGDGGPATAARLSSPVAVAFDGTGGLLVADAANARVRRVAPDGSIATVAGSGALDGAGDGAPAPSAGLGIPRALAVSGAGAVAVPTPLDGRVRAVFPCTAPSAPVPVSPTGTAGYRQVDLLFRQARGAFTHEVRLDTQSPPQRVLAAAVPSSAPTPFWVPDGSTLSVPAANLLPGTAYSWQVIAHGDPACGGLATAASAVASFTTTADCTAPGPFATVSPASGSTVSGSAVTLAWAASAGASLYDVAFGTTNPPPPHRTGVAGTSLDVSGLSPSTTYFWSVVSHASCDAGRTAATPVASFATAGACPAPGPLSLAAPADGATVAAPITLAWAAAPNVASYDVFLGRSDPPPLYAAGIGTTSLAAGTLAAGATYRWKVVGRSGCDPARSVESATRTFTVAGTCSAPAAPSFSFTPPGKVAVGQTYVLAWSPVALDEGGAYLVERSRSASFSPVLDSSITTVPNAAFVPPATGTYHHRVFALAGCDPSRRSPASATVSVEAIEGKPVVVFARPPRGLVTPTGASLDAALDAADPDRSARNFTVQNLSARAVTVIVALNALAPSPPFFRVDDPRGEATASGLTLQPGETRTLSIAYSGVAPSTAASYQGVVYLFAAGQEIVPYAFVNLKIGGQPAAVPAFRSGGVAVESIAFPGLPAGADDAGRAPLAIDVHNPGPGAMELAAEIGPEVWLDPVPGWNDQPIAAGSSRTVQLKTRRSRALAGSAFPRYTYFLVRTRDGATARLLVSDPDRPAAAAGIRPALAPDVPSYVVPSVVHATSKIGKTFVSRLRLSNASSEAIETELIFTPQGADGFDAGQVRRLTVTVPANDVVSLADPLVELFGLAPPAVGPIEVRADAARLGALTVTSAVDAPASGGGTFGFQLPVVRRGDGASLGRPQVVPAISIGPTYRSNVILVETTGRDGATASVALYDGRGTRLGETSLDLPRYGQGQLALSDLLGGAASVDAGLVEVSVPSGGGAVAAVVTVIDNVNDDSSAYVSRPAVATTAPAALRARWGVLDATTARLGVPALVNGYQTFPGAGLPYTFRSQLTLVSASGQPARFTLVYRDLDQDGQETTRSVTVPARGTVTYDNVLEELFGLAPGQKSQGPLTVETDLHGIVSARVYSRLDAGTLGDAFPVVPLPPLATDLLTGAGAARPVALDGLEQSIVASRGTRSNLLLNEWSGKDAVVTVRLYEAGNRTRPIAEEEVALGPHEKVQLSSVFRGVGLDGDERRKDRTNVLCVVIPRSGEGLVSAVVTTIDNRTGDTRNGVLTPAGATAGTGGVGIGR